MVLPPAGPTRRTSSDCRRPRSVLSATIPCKMSMWYPDRMPTAASPGNNICGIFLPVIIDSSGIIFQIQGYTRWRGSQPDRYRRHLRQYRWDRSDPMQELPRSPLYPVGLKYSNTLIDELFERYNCPYPENFLIIPDEQVFSIMTKEDLP
jgi:hypothetical protein